MGEASTRHTLRYAPGGRYMKVVPESMMVLWYAEERSPMERPPTVMSVRPTAYVDEPEYGIHSAERWLGTPPPRTSAPTSSLRQMEKTLGALVAARR